MNQENSDSRGTSRAARWSTILLARANWTVWAYGDNDNTTAIVMVSIDSDQTHAWREEWDYTEYLEASTDPEAFALAVINRCWPEETPASSD